MIITSTMNTPKNQRIKIKVIPRSKQNEIVGKMADGTLKIKIAAVPVDGAANEALIAFLSGVWSIPQTKITIIKGKKGRQKLVEVR